jgi:small subunit ribosomal protein S8e
MQITFRKLFKSTSAKIFMTTRKGRKITGGKYHSARKKILSEKAGQPRVVMLGKEKKKMLRLRGGRLRPVLLRADKVNIIDPKTHKAKVAMIKNVVKVPSNIFLARKNVIVKGAIIDTDAGKARVTNRPGQEGCVNAVLVE